MARSTKKPAALPKAVDPFSIGAKTGTVPVRIGARFVELFSSNLYTSPNKAFEELVSNSWDADANTVYVNVPDSLNDSKAAVWVLDNGESMNADGLRQLWNVANSDKPAMRNPKRPQIGKFGIGKLATYILANRLTYLCRASDGVIRSVVMDYGKIDQAGKSSKGGGGDLMRPRGALELPMRTLTKSQLSDLLSQMSGGDKIEGLIADGIPSKKQHDSYIDEFGHPAGPKVPARKTWTLAIMTDLKEAGRGMQLGRIRWLLRTALPLGNDMAIVFNGEALESSTLDHANVASRAVIGPDLGVTKVVLSAGESGRNIDEFVQVRAHAKPFPHVKIEGIEGPITGSVIRFDRPITGRKSEEIGRSNGYFVNILGRVVNAVDPYFGLKNLNHTVWSQFRACVRVDGLNHEVSVNRDVLTEDRQLEIFRTFLRSLFNKMRVEEDNPETSRWPNAGREIAQSWGLIPLQYLRRAVRQYENRLGTLPDSMTVSPIADPRKAVDEWEAEVLQDPSRAIASVDFAPLGETRRLFVYDLPTRRIIVNLDHPFVQEHGYTVNEKRLLRNAAVVDVLTEAFMIDAGIPDALVDEVKAHRDNLYDLVARISRQSGVTIARLLMDSTANKDAFEDIIHDALEHLGFIVERLGDSGEPEGVAKAPAQVGSADDPTRPYSFTYDAKSSQHGRAKTKDLNVATLVEHKEAHKADYVLIIAPDYQEGQLSDIALRGGVTPARAKTMAKLLLLTAQTGPIDLRWFERILRITQPDEVDRTVDEYISKQTSDRKLEFRDVLDIVATMGVGDTQRIKFAVIAHELHKQKKFTANQVTDKEVMRIFMGIEVLVPTLVSISGDTLHLGTSPAKLQEAVSHALAEIPEEFKYGVQPDALRAPGSPLPREVSRAG
jgi:hypothetical protein